MKRNRTIDFIAEQHKLAFSLQNPAIRLGSPAMKPFTANDFDYLLPEELIAKHPLMQRSASRLLVLDRASQTQRHQQFTDFVDFLDKKDLVVFNDTRVIPARLFGCKTSGGRVECLVERILSSHTVLAHLRCSKLPKPGSEFILAEHLQVQVLGREEGLFLLKFCTEQPVLEILEAYGEIPLPPYFERAPELLDQERYQTVFAERKGAVAAPTAALHFDLHTLQRLAERGIATAKVTLHVGAGTFQPVRVQDLSQHIMHREYVEVSAQTCALINQCKARGGRVFAIGTTVVRSLETAAVSGAIQPYQGDTQLFIYPGFPFRCVDALLTNFHLPKSTLLMLVCAFAGYEVTMQAYQNAIAQRYRFFSYGDAMVVI